MVGGGVSTWCNPRGSCRGNSCGTGTGTGTGRGRGGGSGGGGGVTAFGRRIGMFSEGA